MKTYWKIICSFLFLGIFIHVNVFSQNWQPLNGNLDNPVRALYSDTTDGILYVGGHFKTAGEINVNYIAQWNGTSWDSLGEGSYKPACNIRTITEFRDTIYSYGCFSGEGPFLAKWNGIIWDSITTANNWDVPKLKTIDNELYFMGGFDTIGNLNANKIAKWDGTSWFTFGEGIKDYWLSDCVFFNEELYTCGNIRDDSLSIYHIAKWNGSDWLSVGSDFHNGNWINTMIVYKNELYAGGLFNKSSGCPGNSIAKWDGVNWSDVGGGFNGQIWNLLVFNEEMYAFGNFNTAGGVPASMVAKWDGTKWCSLGSIFDNDISSGCIFNNELYIGGAFHTIDGDSISYIAKWTGGTYVDTCGNTTSRNEINNKENNITIYPNPANDKITVENPSCNDNAMISIYNIQGQLLLQQSIKQQKTEINISGFAGGIYYVKVKTDKGNAVKKFIKE